MERKLRLEVRWLPELSDRLVIFIVPYSDLSLPTTVLRPLSGGGGVSVRRADPIGSYDAAARYSMMLKAEPFRPEHSGLSS